MAKVKYTINQRDLKSLQLKIDNAVDKSTEEGFKFFKKTTPIDKGNARRNTRYREDNNKAVINADYDYAARLDEGYSKQAPRGMTGPTIKFLRRVISQRFRRI